MPVAAPADRRFRRSQVPPVRKRSALPSWRTIAVLLVGGVAALYGVSRAANFALTASALTITEIDVQGTKRMARGEALALLDGLIGANVVTADLEEWRLKLLEAPWVADAAIRRVFPGTVSVVISEREPLAVGRINSVLYLIDRSGAIIDEFGPNYADFDLPIIDGLTGADDNDGAARAALAEKVLADFQRRPALAKRVSQVDVSDVRDAVVLLKDDTVLLHTGDERFLDRVQTYLDLGERLREQVPEMESVDLRIDERIYAKARGTAGR